MTHHHPSHTVVTTTEDWRGRPRHYCLDCHTTSPINLVEPCPATPRKATP